ncbi:HEAT repeat domain-containing protein [Myxococcus sp. Y35]|uniref:HEAT repeat domain-containing protein n=1 Tax=Pseudomyxococcus flavus TaxID=3115648 RepID=UPI003CFAEC90
MAEHEDLGALWRKARPDDLASLRRLDAALVRSGYQVQGKTVREWIAEFPGEPIRWFDGRDASDRMREAGLAAVPALVEALARADHESSWQASLNMRGQCVAALGTIEPLPTCAIPALLGVLRHPGSRVRRMALAVLARMRPHATPAALRAVLPCLREKGDLPVRLQAATALAAMQGPLPDEVRAAGLSLLGEAHRALRREGLHVLARFPQGEEVLTALEEQAILDDENRLEALRVLSGAAPSRAIPRLLEVASNARKRQQEGPPPPAWRGTSGETQRSEDGKKAVLLIGRLGARGAEALASLDALRALELLSPYVDAVIDDITRAVLRQQSPPLRTDRFQEPLCAALLADVAWPAERTEEPSLALHPWLTSLAAFGTEVKVRVALAAARHVLWLWESQDPNNDYSRCTIMAMDRWVSEPTEAHAERVAGMGNFIPSQFCAPDAFSAAWSVNYGSRCVPRPTASSASAPADEEDPLWACVHAACRALSRRSVITWAFGASEAPSEPLSPRDSAREVHRAIVDEVLPWACGAWDPVKDTPRLRKAMRANGWRVPPAF